MIKVPKEIEGDIEDFFSKQPKSCHYTWSSHGSELVCENLSPKEMNQLLLHIKELDLYGETNLGKDPEDKKRWKNIANAFGTI